MTTRDDIRLAADSLRAGGIIAYPTEACFGLGCDPRNEIAVRRLLKIKQRPWQKGLILLAAELRQLQPYIKLNGINMEPVTASWPGAVTWILPARAWVPAWLRGEHEGIAVRVSAHPVASLLSRTCHSAIVSTSANRSGCDPARTASAVRRQFTHSDIDYLLDGQLGKLAQPTPIFDARNGRQLRT